MNGRRLRENVFWVGAVDWDRRLFDSLVHLPDGTSYNAYLVKGAEKTALIDTVDPTMSKVLLSRLEGLGVQDLDYIVANHAEQDHSGSLPQVAARFPRARIVCSPKAKKMLVDLLPIPEDKFITVEDGEKLSLGDFTLEFIHTPWIHWPETMVTYLHEQKTLFSCDFFGSHLATSRLYSEDDWQVYEAARSYYAEVMMPFRTIIRRNLEKLERYPIEMIAPSHGPVHNKPERIVQLHREWVSEAVRNAVVLPYVSMHGSTQTMADYLTEALQAEGVAVDKFNLVVTEMGKLASAVVDAATIVIGSPTVLAGAHPHVISAAFLVNALRPKLRFASIFGSYGWGGKMVDQISSTLSNLKIEMLEPVVAQGYPKDADYRALKRLASEIAAKHQGSNFA
ncbi:MAG: FprA family A-type flavoprotein [Chloroflexi bacterium]|nr:FprA family A-type flavoprotein [Chloroflexota bacterium]